MIKPIATALVAGTLLFVACSKSNSGNASTQKKMEGTGTWDIESLLDVQTNQQTGITDRFFYFNQPPANAYANGSVIFDSSDTLWLHLPVLNKDTAMRYRILNSTSFLAGADTMQIVTLTDSLFIFTNKQSGGLQETFTLIPAN